MKKGVKRKFHGRDALGNKKSKPNSGTSLVKRDLLQQHYQYVQTLREYLLERLPNTSRLRRRKIANLSSQENSDNGQNTLSRLLDTCLVGFDERKLEPDAARWEQWVSFSQRADESYVTLSGGISAAIFSQSEIVDFCIWLLFSRESVAGRWPKHLICDGFRRTKQDGNHVSSTIPGIFQYFPNASVVALKDTTWTQVLALLGQSGERIMIDLLVDCSVFLEVESGYRNYYQLNGFPLSELASKASNGDQVARSPSEISLIRSRIFYSKASLTSRGLVQPGFKHIHALNRYPIKLSSESSEAETLDKKNEANTVKLLMYMFPKQFGLHNVFTSEVDKSKTAQKFQDYTVRDAEMSKIWRQMEQAPKRTIPKIPKRLRGFTRDLVRQLQMQHKRCSYYELLQHYCPDPCGLENTMRHKISKLSLSNLNSRSAVVKQDEKTVLGSENSNSQSAHHAAERTLPGNPRSKFQSVVELACSNTHVFAFCRATLVKLIPEAFWGSGEVGRYNRGVFLRKVHHFICLRRFETISLHELLQGFKLNDVQWLQSPTTNQQKPSQSDTKKRNELFLEFLYYTFDSLLIPLIRSSFYVTESNHDRYRLFYFRHDVWRSVSEPALRRLKDNMFEEMTSHQLGLRKLGQSQIRLLPKRDTVRPIMNLRRKQTLHKTASVLGPSINSILAPVHTVLKMEKNIHPERLGSAMFSVGDIYWKLKQFKNQLGAEIPKLYFAKVDVRAAFNTIPQTAVMALMETVTSQHRYSIAKHAEVRPGDRSFSDTKMATKAVRRWQASALAYKDSQSFTTRLEGPLGSKKKNTVFIDIAARKSWDKQTLIQLMKEHVEQNAVKIGKKLYRQKQGIPQGSVLSSFLCNYFYADLEIHNLPFLQASDSCLLRLVDDFLLITCDEAKAVRFVELMHGGFPEYGVQISPEKTLVNFDMAVQGAPVPKLHNSTSSFPYCGTVIDCTSLNMSKDHSRSERKDISDTLTVEHDNTPGQNFQRKVLNSFKIQSHHMFYDTSHNSSETVLATVTSAFCETAAKMWAYVRCLQASKRPTSSLVIRTIAKTVDVAYLILTSRSRKTRYPEYTCTITKAQFQSAAFTAFITTLEKKQTKYTQVLAWLDLELAKLDAQGIAVRM